jgi:hypothetical protein
MSFMQTVLVWRRPDRLNYMRAIVTRQEEPGRTMEASGVQWQLDEAEVEAHN